MTQAQLDFEAIEERARRVDPAWERRRLEDQRRVRAAAKRSRARVKAMRIEYFRQRYPDNWREVLAERAGDDAPIA